MLGEREKDDVIIAQLQQRCYQLSIAVEQSSVATAITDTQGRIEYVNQRYLEVTGCAREELIGQAVAKVQSAHSAPEAYRDLWQTLRAGRVWRGELLNRRKNGEPYWEAESITPVRNDVGEIVNFVAVKEDITERKDQERELQLLATVFETGQAMLIADAELRIERVNRAFTEITGYRQEEVLGKPTHILKSGRHDYAFYNRLWKELLATDHWQGEIWNRGKDGQIQPLWQSVSAVRDATGEVQHYVAVFHNISERKRMEHELERQATRDHLTGTFNRRVFDAALRQAIGQVEQQQSVFSLLLFDIDHFKAVNDRHGHDVGDAVLKELVERIAGSLRSTDVLCRWGGEEFTILMHDTPLQGATAFAERMRRQVAASRYQGHAITISLGIAEYRQGDDMDSLLQRADQALYRAKKEGRNRLVIDDTGAWEARSKPAIAAMADKNGEKNRMSQAIEALAAKAFYQMGEAMLITDADHRILDANPAFTSLVEMKRESLVGQPLSHVLDGQLAVDDRTNDLIAMHAIVEVTYRKSDGRRSPAIASVTRIPRSHEGPGHQIIAVSGMMALVRLKHKTGHEVYFDALTGLPNPQLLTQLVEESIQHASRRGSSLAVCSLDIDNFKLINDRHGQEFGDSLVVAVAQRISHHLHGDDILARVGGDEFVLLLHQGADEETLNKLLSVIREPFFLKGRRLQITASLGMTFYPRDDVAGDVLLRHANQAMYRAKGRGRNTYHIFDSGQDRAMQDRESKRRRFALALAGDELRLHYQPQVDLFNGQVTGLEALIRWQHPERGLLNPAAFLPILEGTELEIELGEWVLEATLKQLRAWQKQGIMLPVNVNVSPDHLLSEGFSRQLQARLARYPEVCPRRLRLEVLESAAMHDIQAALAVMRHCQALGIDFAIDDFGTGYSSLTILRQLPVDLIKIDRSFVRDMLTDADDKAIVESVIYMAKRFGRPMLAEGVETLEHARVLLEMGCTQVQGFGIARPMPVDDIPAWLDQWGGRHEWSELFLKQPRLDASTIL